MFTETQFTFTGRLNYIDQYKRLHLHVNDPGSLAKLSTLPVCGKHPIADYIDYETKEPTGAKKVRVNLSKYDKPYIHRYEKLLKQDINVCVSVNVYDSEQYGCGTSLTLKSYSYADQ